MIVGCLDCGALYTDALTLDLFALLMALGVVLECQQCGCELEDVTPARLKVRVDEGDEVRRGEGSDGSG